jgi:hypothetical protein
VLGGFGRLINASFERLPPTGPPPKSKGAARTGFTRVPPVPECLRWKWVGIGFATWWLDEVEDEESGSKMQSKIRRVFMFQPTCFEIEKAEGSIVF